MASARTFGLTFVPHLTPLIRSHATLYARLAVGDVDLKTYTNHDMPTSKPFVDVMPPGSHPETRSVRSANMCQLWRSIVPQGGDTVVVLSVIDNLVKGAAGQAVQKYEHHVWL